MRNAKVAGMLVARVIAIDAGAPKQDTCLRVMGEYMLLPHSDPANVKELMNPSACAQALKKFGIIDAGAEPAWVAAVREAKTIAANSTDPAGTLAQAIVAQTEADAAEIAAAAEAARVAAEAAAKAKAAATPAKK